MDQDLQPFENILKSMGIDNFEEAVPLALHEYAKRVVITILSDAKDYSTHAKRPEIDGEDINLAFKLSKFEIPGSDQHQQIEKLKSSINNVKLHDLVSQTAYANKYPPGMLTQRCYTYVPGQKAYQNINNNNNCDDNEVDDEDDEEQNPPQLVPMDIQSFPTQQPTNTIIPTDEKKSFSLQYVSKSVQQIPKKATEFNNDDWMDETED